MKNYSHPSTTIGTISRLFVCILAVLFQLAPGAALAAPAEQEPIGSTILVVNAWVEWTRNTGGAYSSTVDCQTIEGVVYCHFTASNQDTHGLLENEVRFKVTIQDTTSPYNFYIKYFADADYASSRVNPLGAGYHTVPAEGETGITQYLNYAFNSITLNTKFDTAGVGTFTYEYCVAISSVGQIDEPCPVDCTDEALLDTAFIVSLGDIDPRIETPNGPDVEFPLIADDQKVGIAPLTVGDPNLAAALTGDTTLLHLTIDGMWNTTREDYAYSFDGTNWNTLAALDSICASGNSWWFEVTDQDYFYIRANDTAGQFADNTPTAPPFPTFSLSIGKQLEALTCADRFAYTEDDLFATGTVAGNNATGITQTGLVTGDWYVLETTGGPWYENSAPRYDLRVYVAGVDYDFHTNANQQYELSEWQFTTCSETASGLNLRYYFQAPTTSMKLWVNDQDDNFANNTGSLGYKIYHASVVMSFPVECERIFEIDELEWSYTVQSTQANGIYMYPMTYRLWLDMSQPVEYVASEYFVAGQWYMLETKGGPWMDHGIAHWDLEYTDDDGETWNPYTNLEWADCVAPQDELGHVRIYFRAWFPEVDGATNETGYQKFKVRVRDAIENFGDNSGKMSFDVYRVTNEQVEIVIGEDVPPNACLGMYIKGDLIGTRAVPPERAEGVEIPATTSGYYYAIETSGSWTDGSTNTVNTSAEISDDAGETWTDWTMYPSALCMETFDVDGQTYHRLYYKADVNRTYLVRANTQDGNFLDNTDDEFAVKVYEASQHVDPWNDCTTLYTIVPIKRGEILYSHLGGATPSDAQRLDLVPGELYAIETVSGGYQDPDAEEPDATRTTFQLSWDDGETWFDAIDPDMPGYLCYAKKFSHSRIYFNAMNSGTYARIRVKEAGSDFTNNTGQLMYDLYAAKAGTPGTDPDITGYTSPPAIVGCSRLPIKPTAPTSILDIGAWYKYLGDRIQYTSAGFTYFFLWCPQHTAALRVILTDVKNLEPMRTIVRLKTAQETIGTQVKGYSWSLGDTPAVPFQDGGGTEIESLIPEFADTPFTGAPIEFNEDIGGGVDGIVSCDAHLVITMGDSPVAQGFCTVMAFLKMTTLNIYLNIAIVLAAIMLFIRYLVKHWVMFIVRIATHSGA